MIQYTKTVRQSGSLAVTDFDAIINKTALAGFTIVKYELWAFLSGRHRTTWPASSDYTLSDNANGFWSAHFSTTNFNYDDVVSTLPTPYKEGYSFSGWYDNASFTGEEVIAANSTKTLYAKWIAD